MLIDTMFLRTEAALAQIVPAIGALVFDWNGTVVDDLERAVDATNVTLAQFGHAPIDTATFRERFCLPMTAFCTALGLPAEVHSAAIDRWNDALAAYPAPLYPWVAEAIARAQTNGVLVGVVSAAAPASIEADIQASELDSEIGFVFGSVADKSTALRTIAESIAAPVLYVGDTEYDMQAAADAGVTGIAFTQGYRPAASLQATNAAVCFDDYRALIGAFSRLP